MRLLDLSKILVKHKKGWIALAPNNKLLATGGTLREVLKRAKEKGIANPTVFKSPQVDRLFAG